MRMINQNVKFSKTWKHIQILFPSQSFVCNFPSKLLPKKILSLVSGMFALGSKDLVNVSNAVQRFHLQICLLQQKAFPHCQDTCISDPRDLMLNEWRMFEKLVSQRCNPASVLWRDNKCLVCHLCGPLTNMNTLLTKDICYNVGKNISAQPAQVKDDCNRVLNGCRLKKPAQS